jgi:pimeloyl-ACP methyl ester carboxylesterase
MMDLLGGHADWRPRRGETAMPYAQNGSVRIYYEVAGSGPSLLLHCGFVGTLDDWADAGYLAALTDRYRVLRLDPRGQGRSDKPHDSSAYGTRERIGDVLAVLDAEGIERVHYWGYSLGGWVGFALGVFAADRIASLVIGAAHPFTGNPRPLHGDFFLDGFARGMAAFVAACETDDPAFFVSADERARWLAADAVALAAARRTSLTAPDLDPASVAAIQAPTLVYAGTEDDPGPKEMAARLLPNAAFIALDGLNHAAVLERSDMVLPHVIVFLDRVTPTAAG